MTQCYYYSVSSSFSGSVGNIATTKFNEEVLTSLSSSGFGYVNVLGDSVYVCFTSSISPLDNIVLDGIVSAHDGIPYYSFGDAFEEVLDLSGSRSMVGDFNVNGNSIFSASLVNGVVVESHSLRHILTGSDELNGDQIGIDYLPVNYIPQSSIPQAGNTKHLSAHLAGINNALASSSLGSVFGTQNKYIENTIPFSTTWKDGFLTASSMNISSVPSGSYRVGWNYIWSYDDMSNIQFRVLLDGAVDLLNPNQTERPTFVGGSGFGGTDQRYQNSGFRYVNLSSGSHIVQVQVRPTKKGKDATVHFSSLECWRVN